MMKTSHTHCTAAETVKTVLKDRVKSKAAILIPMSIGAFRPEKEAQAPKTSQLSVSDLETIVLIQRWYEQGMKMVDLVNTAPIDPESVLAGVGLCSKQIFILKSERTRYWFDCRGLENDKIATLFRRGHYALGKDRIIQRYIEAWEHLVRNIVRPVSTGFQARRFEVFFIPLPNPTIHRGGWAPRSLRRVATGEKALAHPEWAKEEFRNYALGYTEILIPLVKLMVEQRLAELKGKDRHV